MGAAKVVVNEYWAERQAKAQEEITKRGIKETEKQLAKYYQKTMQESIDLFTKTYNKVLVNMAEGVSPTPSDLYKLDSYWTMQSQLAKELDKLGRKELSSMSRAFTEQYKNIYRAMAMQDGMSFNQISKETAEQMINAIWCADGKSWSDRVWSNTSKLRQELNEQLIECVLTGKPTEVLKKRLVERFGVAYSRADSIVRTEYAHIQTQAAQQRYKDTGVKMVEVWADYDERRCKICAGLHRQQFPVNGTMPLPAHPRCRCTIIPVIEDEYEQLTFDV